MREAVLAAYGRGGGVQPGEWDCTWQERSQPSGCVSLHCVSVRPALRLALQSDLHASFFGGLFFGLVLRALLPSPVALQAPMVSCTRLSSQRLWSPRTLSKPEECRGAVAQVPFRPIHYRVTNRTILGQNQYGVPHCQKV